MNKGKRYTDEQIIRILREVEAGKLITSVCRQYNVSEATVHRWRNKHRAMDQSQLCKTEGTGDREPPVAEDRGSTDNGYRRDELPRRKRTGYQGAL